MYDMREKFTLEELLDYSMIELPEYLENGIDEMQEEMSFELNSYKDENEELQESLEDVQEQANIVLEFMSKKVKENKTSVTFKNDDYEELTKDINDIYKLSNY